MLVIDTSALIAIINHEPERRQFLEIIANASELMLSAMTWYETMIVARNLQGERGVEILLSVLIERNVTIMPFDAGAAVEAVAAYQKFGGRKHPAHLSFGDCPAYTLAKTMGCPLLFKGNDFAQTDIVAATSLPTPAGSVPPATPGP